MFGFGKTKTEKAEGDALLGKLAELLQSEAITAEEHAQLVAAIGGAMPAPEPVADAAPAPAADPSLKAAPVEDVEKAALKSKLEAIEKLLAEKADTDAERAEVNKAAALQYLPVAADRFGKAMHALRKSNAEAAEIVFGVVKAMGAAIDMTKLTGAPGSIYEPEAGDDDPEAAFAKAVADVRKQHPEMDYGAASALVKKTRPELAAKL